MKNTFTLLLLATFFLSSCTQSDSWELHQGKKAAAIVYEQVPADFIPRKLTVLSAGDSLTQGVGDSTENGGYLPYLKTMLEEEKGIKEVEFYNFGVTGNRTTQLLKRLKSKEIRQALAKTDLVILTIGGNDIMKVVKDNIANLQLSVFEKEREVYIDHLYQIMDSIVQVNPKASIVLVGLYNPFSKWFADIEEFDQIVSDWNRAGQRVIANYPNSYYVEIEDLFLNAKENLLYSDNFHPNDKGYELIAGKLNETLEERTLPDLEKNATMVSKEEE